MSLIVRAEIFGRDTFSSEPMGVLYIESAHLPRAGDYIRFDNGQGGNSGRVVSHLVWDYSDSISIPKVEIVVED